MYNEFYDFESDPFNVTPDPDFIYYSDQHKDVLAHMLYGVRERRGFIVVTGRVGSGKTTLCRAFLREIGDDTSTALILNSKMTAPELLEAIAEDFGYEVPPDPRSKEIVDALNDFLLSEYQSGRNACVLIDESQNLSPEALEQLRLISNLETEKEKLLQIVLVGQPELDDLLNRPELRQLQQRVAMRAYLTNLDAEETRDYLRHRIRRASREDPSVRVEDDVFPRLYEHTDGNPRAINLLADRMLMAAYLDDSFVVGASHLEEALEDLDARRPPDPPAEEAPVRPEGREEPPSDGSETTSMGPSLPLELPAGGTALLVASASALVTLVLGIALITAWTWWVTPPAVIPPGGTPTAADTTAVPGPGAKLLAPAETSPRPGVTEESVRPDVRDNPLDVRPVAGDTGPLPDHGFGSLALARYVSLYAARLDGPDTGWRRGEEPLDGSVPLSELVPAYLPAQFVDQQGKLSTLARYGFPVLIWWEPRPDRGRYRLYDPVSDRLWDPLDGRVTADSAGSLSTWRGTGRVLVRARWPIGSVQREGEKGARVRWLQRLLRGSREEPFPITGYYGPETRRAVRTLQRRYGLDPDGRAGAPTKLFLLRENDTAPEWNRGEIHRFVERLEADHVPD